MYESLVVSPRDDRTIPLRRSFLDLCGGDRNAAFLLSVLEFWTNHHHRENQIRKRLNEEMAQRGQDEEEHYPINEELWVHRTRQEIVEDSLGVLTKKAVTTAADQLEEWGYIETDHPYRYKGDNRKYYRLRLDRLNADLTSEIIGQHEGERRKEEEKQKIAERRDERIESGDTWSEDDWQMRYAKRWWERMDDLGNGRINSDWRKRKSKILEGWADAFDWVVTTRDIPKEKLDTLIYWLFEEEGWWIPTGNLIAPTKFREKNDQGQWRVNELLMKMEIEMNGNGRGVSVPDPGEEVGEYKRKNLLKNDKADEEDFVSVGFQSGGENKIYKYQP